MKHSKWQRRAKHFHLLTSAAGRWHDRFTTMASLVSIDRRNTFVFEGQMECGEELQDESGPLFSAR
jgi:hypothetical protein